jgi:D-sedoheptulose 7-phosphate isomerase
MIKNSLKRTIEHSIAAKKSLLLIDDKIEQSINIIFKKLSLGGKILLCGNGGSAADAQHLAAEFLIRLDPKRNRMPIPAISLATDVSTITACGNDFSFNKIFSRNLDALGSTKDILIVISTSGKSKNILEALKMAKKKKIFSIGFFGNNGGEAKKYTDLSLNVKGNSVARIQETHILLGHYIFEHVEKKFVQ